MKIRTGFVSNSSASSFLLYGIILQNDTCDEDDEIGEGDDTTYGRLETANAVAGGVIDIEFAYDQTDEIYVGLSLNEIELDETRRQFQERVEKAVRELCTKAKVEIPDDTVFRTYTEAWY